VPPEVFHQELDRWGVVELFVWSAESAAYLASDPRYHQLWTDGVWTQFRRDGADSREVAVTHGEATLVDRFVGGARVHLTRATVGELVVVRTNFHPSWTARTDSAVVPLRDEAGQLAFAAPCDAPCVITLEYPRRVGLRYLAVIAWVLGMFVVYKKSA